MEPHHLHQVERFTRTLRTMPCRTRTPSETSACSDEVDAIRDEHILADCRDSRPTVAVGPGAIPHDAA